MDVLGNGVERREVAGVRRGGVPPSSSASVTHMQEAGFIPLPRSIENAPGRTSSVFQCSLGRGRVLARPGWTGEITVLGLETDRVLLVSRRAIKTGFVTSFALPSPTPGPWRRPVEVLVPSLGLAPMVYDRVSHVLADFQIVSNQMDGLP